jgi:hypothetical protein
VTVNILGAKHDDVARACGLDSDAIEESASPSDFSRINSRKGTRKFVMCL